MSREAAFRTGRYLIAHTDVGEGTTHHHLVIASTTSKRVEVTRLDSVSYQVLTSGAVMRERAGWTDVVGGHRITDLYQNPSTVNRFYRSRFGLDSLEEGR